MNACQTRSRTLATACALLSGSCAIAASPEDTHLYLDVHDVGSVTVEAVADAHRKDLAVQDQYGVRFIRYWVDDENGKIYCLAEAPNAAAVSEAHASAHGLVPQSVHEVTAGSEAPETGKTQLYLDVHHVGPGKVTPGDVAQAHEKDLAVQGAHGVRFINYWVDPGAGDIFCLSEAPSAEAVLATHREAHGLVSDEVERVTEGK
ncbi:MAG: DUF4242 domain-containing protein [Steroidobacteraceae bacterium]